MQAAPKPKPRRRRDRKTPGCNCKKTRCLKLYCECFAKQIFCRPVCKCETCYNADNSMFEAERLKAVKATLRRSATAFYRAPTNTQSRQGCKCVRSNCASGYCECYQSKKGCMDSCKCMGCQNEFGTKEEWRGGEDDATLDPTNPKNQGVVPWPATDPSRIAVAMALEANQNPQLQAFHEFQVHQRARAQPSQNAFSMSIDALPSWANPLAAGQLTEQHQQDLSAFYRGVEVKQQTQTLVQPPKVNTPADKFLDANGLPLFNDFQRVATNPFAAPTATASVVHSRPPLHVDTEGHHDPSPEFNPAQRAAVAAAVASMASPHSKLPRTARQPREQRVADASDSFRTPRTSYANQDGEPRRRSAKDVPEYFNFAARSPSEGRRSLARHHSNTSILSPSGEGRKSLARHNSNASIFSDFYNRHTPPHMYRTLSSSSLLQPRGSLQSHGDTLFGPALMDHPPDFDPNCLFGPVVHDVDQMEARLSEQVGRLSIEPGSHGPRSGSHGPRSGRRTHRPLAPRQSHGREDGIGLDPFLMQVRNSVNTSEFDPL
mmetsp:Transcript_37472/g.73717  ORF Transcript_37472/g.73717 Transcript_37472/m.73717 type:complete len:546 (+) Transcript_37472:1171-2808(+)